MKTFQFHAQQGQENQVCRLLTQNVGNPTVTRTEKGVIIKVNVPVGMSKRSIDQMLFRENVPGAVSRRNKYKVVAVKSVRDLIHKVHKGDIFKLVLNKRFVGVCELINYNRFNNCPCCSYELLAAERLGDGQIFF